MTSCKEEREQIDSHLWRINNRIYTSSSTWWETIIKPYCITNCHKSCTLNTFWLNAGRIWSKHESTFPHCTYHQDLPCMRIHVCTCKSCLLPWYYLHRPCKFPLWSVRYGDVFVSLRLQVPLFVIKYRGLRGTSCYWTLCSGRTDALNGGFTRLVFSHVCSGVFWEWVCSVGFW
jgi:hypothetical protein